MAALDATSLWRARARAGTHRCIVLTAALALGGCGPSSTDPADGDKLVVQVLPLEVRGQEEGADYLGRAVARSLAASFVQSDDLLLKEVPESAGAAAAASRDVDRSTEKMATRSVTGTLTRDGDAIHVSLQLLDPRKDEVLWGTEMSSGSEDLSGLVFRVARQAIQAMGVSYPELYDHIMDVTGSSPMSDSPQAARARDAMRRYDFEEFLQASSDLVAQYPDDPVAHVFSAWATMLAWDAEPSNEDYLAQLKDRMVSLDRVDPSSPYDEVMRGYIYRSSGQPDQARALYSRVLARKDLSSAARAWIIRQRSFTHLASGNAVAARADAEEAVALDPSNALSLVALSKALEAEGRLDEAIAGTSRALVLQPSSWRHFQRLGLVYSRADRLDEAVLSFDRACTLGERQEACANHAVTLQRAGREAEARAAATNAESLSASRWGHYNLACYRALAGDRAAAIRDLRRSLELGFADALITTDSDLESLRGDPEFEAVVDAVEERIRSRQELSTSVFPWQA
jgi:Flp pilus assembly protein TadD/TolB-like protein